MPEWGSAWPVGARIATLFQRMDGSTSEQATVLRREGERAGALAERGMFPFDGTHTDFRP